MLSLSAVSTSAAAAPSTESEPTSSHSRLRLGVIASPPLQPARAQLAPHLAPRQQRGDDQPAQAEQGHDVGRPDEGRVVDHGSWGIADARGGRRRHLAGLAGLCRRLSYTSLRRWPPNPSSISGSRPRRLQRLDAIAARHGGADRSSPTRRWKPGSAARSSSSRICGSGSRRSSAGKGIPHDQAMRQIDAAIEAAAKRAPGVARLAADRPSRAAGDLVAARPGSSMNATFSTISLGKGEGAAQRVRGDIERADRSPCAAGDRSTRPHRRHLRKKRRQDSPTSSPTASRRATMAARTTS